MPANSRRARAPPAGTRAAPIAARSPASTGTAISRPIFTGGRIFALMGTDLVEGRMAAGRIGEVGRLDLTRTPRG